MSKLSLPARRFIAKWEDGFVFPVRHRPGRPTELLIQNYDIVPFPNDGVVDQELLDRIEKMVTGKCLGVFIQCAYGMHLNCTCFCGALLYPVGKARSKRELLEKEMRAYGSEAVARQTVSYLQWIYPKEYEALPDF